MTPKDPVMRSKNFPASRALPFHGAQFVALLAAGAICTGAAAQPRADIDSGAADHSARILGALLQAWPASRIRGAPLLVTGDLPVAQRAAPALGVEQVRQAPDAGANAVQPPPSVGPGGALRAPGVRQGGDPAPASSATSTSLRCAEGDVNAECLLGNGSDTDWKRRTGVEADPVTGAPLVPGVTLNPTRP